MKIDILQQYKNYFKNTSKEKIISDWEECSITNENSIEVEKYFEFLDNFKPTEVYDFNTLHEPNERMVYFLSC